MFARIIKNQCDNPNVPGQEEAMHMKGTCWTLWIWLGNKQDAHAFSWTYWGRWESLKGLWIKLEKVLTDKSPAFVENEILPHDMINNRWNQDIFQIRELHVHKLNFMIYLWTTLLAVLREYLSHAFYSKVSIFFPCIPHLK